MNTKEFIEDSNWPSMQNEITRIAIKCEEEVVIQVLTQLLKRPPGIEDFKRCYMCHHYSFTNSYRFDYKLPNDQMIELGMIERKYEGAKMVITFTPNPKYKS